MKQLTKPFYLVLGWLSLALGFIGVVLPVMPTTPFLIVALWAFSRSSPRLAAKMRSNPTVGPYLRDWEEHGVIPLRAKILAILAMSASVASMIVLAFVPPIGIGLVALIMLLVAIYILTRPSTPRKKE